APTAAQSRMPQTQGPFPTFPMGPLLHAVRIDANANLSMRLLMTSLQGLVNRASVELYLDVPGVAGNTSRMLAYLASRYNVAYDRALRELYPSSYPYLLAILPPDRWAIRDYLVQTGTFVFYLTQGMLASPFEAAATMRILQAAPRGIPILGWFNSPTLTEENSFVQMASAAGKFVVGVQDVPNLSVLTALGRNETHRQVSSIATPTPVLEDKTYLVLAVPDGDNLDFVAGRMWDLWS